MVIPRRFETAHARSIIADCRLVPPLTTVVPLADQASQDTSSPLSWRQNHSDAARGSRALHKAFPRLPTTVHPAQCPSSRGGASMWESHKARIHAESPHSSGQLGLVYKGRASSCNKGGYLFPVTIHPETTSNQFPTIFPQVSPTPTKQQSQWLATADAPVLLAATAAPPVRNPLLVFHSPGPLQGLSMSLNVKLTRLVVQALAPAASKRLSFLRQTPI